jgi:hypothetical protein
MELVLDKITPGNLWNRIERAHLCVSLIIVSLAAMSFYQFSLVGKSLTR